MQMIFNFVCKILYDSHYTYFFAVVLNLKVCNYAHITQVYKKNNYCALLTRVGISNVF